MARPARRRPERRAGAAALDRLYEKTQSWRELVDVLRARERLADDKDARRTLLVRIATTLAEKLADVPEAILAYRAVVDDFGADRGSLASLSNLYELADRWQDLADALEADLALADSAGGQARDPRPPGRGAAAALRTSSGAIEAYRQALVLDPSHARLSRALEAMLDRPRRAARGRRHAPAPVRGRRPAPEAARGARHRDRDADSHLRQAATIAQAAQVAEGPLGDRRRALAYAARGLREAVAEPELPRWIERAERLAPPPASTPSSSSCCARAWATSSTGTSSSRSRCGSRRSRAPGWATRARQEYYVKALELRGDDRRALVALESLYEETGDNAALLDIVKRRADAAESETERRQLLFKQARPLRREAAATCARPSRVYEQILDLELDACGHRRARAALRAGPSAGRTSSRSTSARSAATGLSHERKAALHHALGERAREAMNEIDRAFDEYAAALEHRPEAPADRRVARGAHGRARARARARPRCSSRCTWRGSTGDA